MRPDKPNRQSSAFCYPSPALTVSGKWVSVTVGGAVTRPTADSEPDMGVSPHLAPRPVGLSMVQPGMRLVVAVNVGPHFPRRVPVIREVHS